MHHRPGAAAGRGPGQRDSDWSWAVRYIGRPDRSAAPLRSDPRVQPMRPPQSGSDSSSGCCRFTAHPDPHVGQEKND